jgi:hypothetical protein
LNIHNGGGAWGAINNAGPLFGFTKSNELFVGRLAQLGVVFSIIGEIICYQLVNGGDVPAATTAGGRNTEWSKQAGGGNSSCALVQQARIWARVGVDLLVCSGWRVCDVLNLV